MWIRYQGNIPFLLKHPNITTMFKKSYRVSKSNCRPVSILQLSSRYLKNCFEETQSEASDSLTFNFCPLELVLINVKSICKKASSKLRALTRAISYMDIWKRKLLLNVFFNAHFNYCPLIWIVLSHFNNSLFKVNNRNTRTRCEICSKLTIKIPKRCQIDFVLVSLFVLVFLFLTLDMQVQVGSCVSDLSTLTNALHTTDFCVKMDQFLATMKILITCYWAIEMFEVKNTLTKEIVEDTFVESWKPLLSSKPKWFQTTCKNCLSRQWEHVMYRSKNLG